VYRDIAFYQGVEAGVKTTMFAKLRSKMAGAGMHGKIPNDQKDQLMAILGEPPTMWNTYEGEYRNMFPRNKPGSHEYVGETLPGDRTVVRTDFMLHRAGAKHTLAASPGVAADLNKVIGGACSLSMSCLQKSTPTASHRRKFNREEAGKFVKGACLTATNARKTRFNGERATREEDR
jgi:hypothetical protein